MLIWNYVRIVFMENRIELDSLELRKKRREKKNRACAL